MLKVSDEQVIKHVDGLVCVLELLKKVLFVLAVFAMFIAIVHNNLPFTWLTVVGFLVLVAYATKKA